MVPPKDDISPALAEHPVLEVIATSVADARAAARGGAHRLEVVSAMQHDGLTPDPDLIRRIRDSVSLPLRVMLRPTPSFTISAPELDALADTARRLRAGGIDQFVFGFLTAERELDLSALQFLAAAIQSARWTLHRAFDHTPDQVRAFAQCDALPQVDRILTSGSSDSLDAGLESLCDRASWQTRTLRWIAGGGLRPEHVPSLRAAGIAEFHTGRAVRIQQRWDAPIDEALVRYVAETVLGGVSHPSRSS